ncbi:preprotein translocase subunit SecF [Rickettsiales bacterium Ac37b]|nr:preprotein translocase subunit SecF [Rickettsiales bacterium Ac37b]
MKIPAIRFISDNTNIDFMQKRYISFIFTAILIILSILSIATKGLNYGIDFSGGVLIEARIQPAPDLTKLRNILNNLNIGEISLQNFSNDNSYIMIRLAKNINNHSQQQDIELIKSAITSHFPGKIEYRKIDYVGPQVGQELTRNGIYAILLSFLSIMLYIWVRFEWQYGIGLIIALIHDAIVAIGFMSFAGLECNLTSVAAILTIIGYSVNDSVVIYDRIRENIRKYRKLSISELINMSINNTLSRTILTVLTTLLATIALIFFGGESIRSFSLVVFFGIIIGTYSSIFVSAPILIHLNLKR